jgi:hypothetical protein
MHRPPLGSNASHPPAGLVQGALPAALAAISRSAPTVVKIPSLSNIYIIYQDKIYNKI